MNFLAKFIHSMEATERTGVDSRHMVAIVGKVFSWRDSWRFAHDFFSLDHELAPIGVLDYPVTSEQGNDAIGSILNGDKINECVRLIRRQAFTPVMVHEFVELSR